MTEKANGSPPIPEIESPLASIEQAIEDFRAGKLVIIVDDEDRENEGDLAIAAEFCTADAINFMARHGCGLICMPIIGERLDALEIPLMVSSEGPNKSTAFTVTVDARDGITTGISAEDRAETVRALIDPTATPADFLRPGHMFPLRYTEGGVLRRTGHTEASVDLAKLAGLYPAAVICEVMNENGSMARFPHLVEFARQHGITMVNVAQIVQYRRRTELQVERVADADLPTEFGDFRCIAYRSIDSGDEHIALVKGDPTSDPSPLVRIHSECLTGDVFRSRRCDCGDQLHAAMRIISDAGSGVVVYLRAHEGRGIGLVNKIRAYKLQESGMDTVEANLHLGYPPDARDFSIGASILADIGVTRARLLTNNPKKRSGIEGPELEIVERVPLITPSNGHNERYLRSKQEKLGHLLEV
ncbi:MAG: bifunctional 3,4-dihydroxy-2-butanone-4-phosphate synthase/GTP cyclohydrolase II [Chloroflexota bacterium]